MWMGESVRKGPLRVVLDSNALFVPLQFRFDVFGELERLLKRRFELVLLSAVKRELEVLAVKGSVKVRRDAGFALGLAGRLRVGEVDVGGSGLTDDVIVEAARELGAVVFTNDKVLRRRLRDISVPVIYVRQKSRLEIDGLV